MKQVYDLAAVLQDAKDRLKKTKESLHDAEMMADQAGNNLAIALKKRLPIGTLVRIRNLGNGVVCYGLVKQVSGSVVDCYHLYDGWFTTRMYNILGNIHDIDVMNAFELRNVSLSAIASSSLITYQEGIDEGRVS